jgi:NADH dehydrogenase [ubiquinone] 1 alpha subcomplex assembly factor 7
MKKIIKILKKKSIPLDSYINLALYDKNYGYYMKKNPFGEKGDFITSPLITSLFSEMVAIWCVAFWENLGKPKKIFIVEMGPGDGSMCNSLLNIFKNFSDFNNCVKIKLLEKSDFLKKIQKNNIKSNIKKVKWIKKINNLKTGPNIFIGNEFFDSLAIKQFYRKKESFFERYISLSKSSNKIKFIYPKAKKSLINKIKKLNLISKSNIIEYPSEAIKYLDDISIRIKKYGGGLLSFDYGYTQLRGLDTLQAVKKHKYSNILSLPGSSDITSHLNYKLFSEILKKNNLRVEKIISQNEFLQKMGILERANILSKTISFKAKADMFYRLKKILHNNEMGELFKVMYAKKKDIKFNLGF